MKNVIQLFLLLLVFSVSICSAQDQHKTDSLFTALSNAKEDTAKVNTLNAVAYEFRKVNSDTAIYFGKEALALATKLNYQVGIADAYMRIGMANIGPGRFDEALRNCKEALKLYDQLLASGKTIDNPKLLKQKANAYNSIGIIYYYQGNYPEGLKNGFASLKIREELKDKQGISDSYNNIGLNYLYQTNYPEALKNYFASLKIREELGDKRGIADCYTNIGSIYFSQGNYPEALKNHLAALRISEEVGDKRSLAAPYNNIGLVYFNQGNYPEALKNHLASLKIRQEFGDKRGIAASYNNLGNIYYAQKKYPEALQNYFASLKIRNEIGDQQGIASSYDNIGFIYQEQGNYPEALKNHFIALKMRKEIGDKDGIAVSSVAIGKIYTQQKRYREASEYLNNGLSVAKEIGSFDDMNASYDGLTQLDSTQGNFKEALKHYKLLIATHDSLVNEENTKKIVQSQMQYDFDKKDAVAKAEQDKKDALVAEEIKRQSLIKNSIFAGIGIAVIFSFLLVLSFNRRRKTSFEKQVSEVEMKALRSQMNPHFIFNSLRSINEYIQSHKTTLASEYLIKFSKLMRAILENSRQKEIVLSKEIEVLELYMQLESQRMEHPFSYTLEIDPEIDPENTLIPPMLLQPIVENSIWHGLAPKEKPGKIVIRIKKRNETIQCEVEDDGIGRKVSDVPGKESKAESYGLKITAERLTIIEQIKKIKTNLAFRDLRGADHYTGLSVTFALPFEEAV